MSDAKPTEWPTLRAAPAPAPLPDPAEFEVYDDLGEDGGEDFYAGTSGSRESAWKEIQGYAAKLTKPVIYEVIRRRIEP